MSSRVLLGLILLFGVAAAAHSEMVVLEDAGVFTGAGLHGNVHRFEITQSGVYRATLTDFEFPEPADSLGFIVATSTQMLAGATSPGSLTFQAQAGQHFLNVFGTPGGATQVANYGVQVQALPLPPAAMLFAGALVALAAVGRHLRGEA